jgi:peptidoglycan/xylan/chitin deacetylase (PgdA/CDA1 family)
MENQFPDKLIVLTFDDSCKSDVNFAAPLLKSYGFGATFFATEGFRRAEDWDKKYLDWADIQKIHNMGFEIGNHTRRHPSVKGLSEEEFRQELEHIEERCREHSIPRPTSFCYPTFSFDHKSAEVLSGKGYLFARRGVSPEFPDLGKGARGPAYDPDKNHPLLTPCTGYSGPNWGFEDFVWAVKQARDNRIAVLTFHGVPDLDHPWVHTEPAVFKTYMDYLRDNGYTVISLRGLARYIDPKKYTGDPLQYATIGLERKRTAI